MKQYTRKELRRLVAEGLAIDVSNAHDRKDIPEEYTQIGYSHGIYGSTGKLFRGKSGQLYAVTSSSSALYIF